MRTTSLMAFFLMAIITIQLIPLFLAQKFSVRGSPVSLNSSLFKVSLFPWIWKQIKPWAWKPEARFRGAFLSWMRLVIWFCLITFVEWCLPGGQRRAAEASGAAVGVSWCLGRGRLGCSCFADRGGFRGHGSWEWGANTPSTRGATNSDPGEGEGGISSGPREGGWGDGKGGAREGGTNSGDQGRDQDREGGSLFKVPCWACSQFWRCFGFGSHKGWTWIQFSKWKFCHLCFLFAFL